jgi:hypothetical protein
MTLPQERQLREQSHGVKREHYIRFLKGEEHLHLKGIYVNNGWRPLQVQNIFNIYNNICNSNNKRHKKVYKLLNYKQREW